MSSSFLILCPMHNLITSHCVTLAGSKVGFGSHVSLIYYISHSTGRLLMLLNHGFYHIILCLETVSSLFHHMNFSFLCLSFKVLKIMILSQAYATQMHCPLLSKPFITDPAHAIARHAIAFLKCPQSPAMPAYSPCPLRLSLTFLIKSSLLSALIHFSFF